MLGRHCCKGFSSIVGTMATPGTKYGLRYTVSLIPGDGTGKEVTKAVKDVLKAANAPIDWEEIPLSGYDNPETIAKLLDQTIESIRRNKIAFKGKLHSNLSKGQSSMNLAIRKTLDVFANITIIKTRPGTQARHQNVNFVVIRENLEGEYSGLEHQPVPGVVESLKICTRPNAERIIKFAFDYAISNNRKKITCIHKANIMKLSDGLFLQIFKEMAEKYSSYNLETNDMIVDNASMQMVSNPQQFDVVVAPNLFGNIATNIGAGLVGSPGLTSGYSIGRDYAIFEHSARREMIHIAGKNLVNPVSSILCASYMLVHLGLENQGIALRQAIRKVLSEGMVRTQDMGGNNSTEQMTEAIINAL